MRLGRVTLRWPLNGRSGDPYWETFVNKAPADPNGLVAEAIRRHPEGTVYPVKTDVHSPAIMSQHIKELAHFLGADLCGIAALGAPGPEAGGSPYPFAVVCGLYSKYDPAVAPGVGGQAAVLNGVYVTFNVAAWIRECGYRATREGDGSREELAERAGLARRDSAGRLIQSRRGAHLYIADVLFTDLPLAPDGPST